ncbi:MAG: hypothetical protein WCK33_08895 [Phycisphaerae bacterium]
MFRHMIRPSACMVRAWFLVSLVTLWSAAAQATAAETVHRPFAPAGERLTPSGGVIPPWAATHRIDPIEVEFMAASGNVVDVELPLGPGLSVVAELRRTDVLTPGARVVVAGDGGVETPLMPTVTLWTGRIGGDPS